MTDLARVRLFLVSMVAGALIGIAVVLPLIPFLAVLVASLILIGTTREGR